MATGKFVSYIRVSTERQGRSGLGLDAQRRAVGDYLNGGKWSVLGEFVEVESGKNDARPMLADALALCRLHNAVLVIAKLDRLSRDAGFLINLQKAGVRFVAADMPEANETMVQMMAVFAQAERKLISKRTKEALAAAKARGVKLGGNRGHGIAANASALSLKTRRARAAARGADLSPTLERLRIEGVTSATGLAKALSERGIPTARGGSAWSAVQVQRVLAILSA